MNLPKRVFIHEVGPRDGLQNESVQLSTAQKIELIDRLSACGFSYLEIGSFVNPKWIPQLADSLDVAKRIRKASGTAYAALVPNLKGYENFRASGLDTVALFMSASETHNQKNINKSIAQTYPVFRETADAAKADGKKILGYVSTVFGCPYEGNVPVENVLSVTRELLSMGCEQISLGDTVGYANPRQVQQLLGKVFQIAPATKFSMHFHDTRGTALANYLAALESGAVCFDGSVGGLGGCPYAPGASGNAATEEIVYLFQEMGVETGVDLPKLIEAASFLEKTLGRELQSRYYKSKKSEKRP